MEADTAIQALAALAHPTRLALFRLLAASTQDGMAAGEIARRLDIAPSTLSHHLAALERPGLIGHDRQQRHLLYGVHPPTVRALIGFLTDQCCGGRPDLCGGSGMTDGNAA